MGAIPQSIVNGLICMRGIYGSTSVRTYVPAAARINCLCESPEFKNRNPSSRPTVIPSSAAGPTR